MAKETTLSELGEMIERGFSAVASDIARLETRIDSLDAKIDRVEANLSAKIDRLDVKLTKFEESEIDKRKQLEVRVARLGGAIGPRVAGRSGPDSRMAPSWFPGPGRHCSVLPQAPRSRG